MLEVRDLSVKYGEAVAVVSASFSVGEREIVALLGSNGAGKTSILRAISGVVPASGGSIRFKGEDITNLPAHQVVRRGIAHVPEGRRIFGRLTVRENLLLGGLTVRERGALGSRLDMVYDLFPRLRERLEQKAGTLSGGELQMLAIARALMARPSLLMLDEPSLGLAPNLVSIIFETLRRIREEGTTILLVEQNVAEALDLADRAYVIQSGEIALSGTAGEMRESDLVRRAFLGM